MDDGVMSINNNNNFTIDKMRHLKSNPRRRLKYIKTQQLKGNIKTSYQSQFS